MKNCVICGKEFQPHSNASKVCSKECRTELRRRTFSRCYQKRIERERLGEPIAPLKPSKKHKEYNYKPREGDSLCWTCQNYGGKCSWSRAFKPVDGWEVEIKKVIHKEKGKVREDTITKVVKCPEYKQDERRH